MLQGDRNSKFFHRVTKNNYRKKFSPIPRWWLGVDDSIPEGIQRHSQNYFQAIYSNTNGMNSVLASLPSYISLSISEADNDMLLALPSEEDIRAATFSNGRDKVPGPDGYNSHFFQTY